MGTRREGRRVSNAPPTRDYFANPAHTQPEGIRGPRTTRPPLQVTRAPAHRHAHRTTSPTGITKGLYRSPRESRPTRGPTTLRSAVPAPHTCRSGVYTHKQLGGGGDASLLGVGTHTAPSAILLLYTPHPLPAHGCPPTPTLQTPGNQTANAAPMRGSGPRWSFNVKGETYPTQTRGPWDTSSRNTQARHQAHRRPRPPPQTEPPPPARPPPQQFGTVTCSSSRRTRAGAHPAPVRVTRHREPSFSEPVNLTPAPPGGSIPQAQFHRGDRNNNIYFLKLTESPPWGNVQSCDRNGSTD